MIFNGLVKDLWRSTVCVDVLDCALVSTVVVVRFWAPCAVFNPVNTGSAPPPAWRNRICNQHPSVSGYHSSPGHVSMETDRRTSEGGRERGSPVCFCGTMSKMCRWNENHLHLVWILVQFDDVRMVLCSSRRGSTEAETCKRKTVERKKIQIN